MTFQELKDNIKCLYDAFFKDMKIDKHTGIVDGTNLRFTGFPYIGSNYVNAPIKILFISLDTGIDECFESNTYHSLEDRENIFADGYLDFNPHIAGIYATALYLLKDRMNLQSAWEKLWNLRNSHKNAKAIKVAADFLPHDLMSYVAYENRYRFVTKGRGNAENDKRSGGNDRVWLNAKRESILLMDEIDAFSPDIVVFQGKDGLWNCNIERLKEKYQVVMAYHPSYWQRGADRLQYIVDFIAPQIKL